jgi:hypothetical protein
LFWFIEFAGAVNRAEYTINEFAGVFAAKCFGQFNGFVDGDFGWHFALDHKLVDTNAQDYFIDFGYLVYGPLWGGRSNDGVDVILVRMHAVYYVFDEIGVVDVGTKFVEVALKDGRELETLGVAAPEVVFIERLHGDDAAEMTVGCHVDALPLGGGLNQTELSGALETTRHQSTGGGADELNGRQSKVRAALALGAASGTFLWYCHGSGLPFFGYSSPVFQACARLLDGCLGRSLYAGAIGAVEDFDGKAQDDFLLNQRREINLAVGDGHIVVFGLFSKDLL